MRAARLTGWRAPLEIGEVPSPTVRATGSWSRCWPAASAGRTGMSGPGPTRSICRISPGMNIAAWSWRRGRGARLARGRPGDRAVHPGLRGLRRLPGREPDDLCDAGLPGFTCDGAFAERVAVAHADANLTRLPEGMDPALAAALGCRVTTAWHALTGRAALRPGEWLGIWGGGGVGMAALMLGKAMGARVALADVVPEKLASRRATLGAEVVIDASGEDPAEAMREATGGGVDLAVEALGLPVTTANALRSLRKLGRMVQVGMPAGDHLEMTPALGCGLWRAACHLRHAGHAGASLSRASGFHRGHGTRPFADDRAPRGLSDASAELALFDGPAPPGIAVITDFAA
jgi:NADPH:quinone reductase-like Zn-dependent oxidoreductase